MDRKVYADSFEFKYSIQKVLIRVGIGAILAISGGWAYFRLEKYFDRQKTEQLLENVRNEVYVMPKYSAWAWTTLAFAFIIFIIGFMIFFDIYKLFRKRVFLHLTPSCLQHNDLEFLFFFRVPYIKESYFVWSDILDAKIKRNIFFGSHIVLTLSDAKKKRDRTYSISTISSECEPEYILQSIRMNMRENA